MRSVTQRSRTGFRMLATRLGTIVALLVTAVGPGLRPGVALASSVSSASFSGGAGTVVHAGTLYAKNGGALTLNVATSADTECVTVTGAFSTHVTSATPQSSWALPFTAGAGDGLQTVTVAASSGFNSTKCTGASSGNATASFVLDNTGPVVTANVSPTPNAAGWDNANVAITWVATDAGSGVASGPTPASASQAANTTGTAFTSGATDNLGNSGSGSVTVKLDKTPPAITGSQSPAPNSNGWNNTGVTVSFSCSDTVSGIKSCSPGTAVTTQGANQPVTGTALDNADNSSSTTVSVSIDETPPSLSGAPLTSPNSAGWYSSDVTVQWTCSDALSGILTCPANSTITGEGTGLVATATATDKAGNSATASSSPAVKIDRTAPLTTVTAPSGWNNTAQTISLSATDNLSGVQATYYSIDGGAATLYSAPFTIATEGNHSVGYWSVDKAGNTEAQRTAAVKIDLTSPTISDTHSPVPNAGGWNDTPVTIAFVCADALSGVASCTPPQTVSAEGTGQPVTGTATDNAGNSASDTTSVSIDLTPPTISGSRSPGPNAYGWNNSDVTVSFSCGDALSGVASCPGAQTLSGDGLGQSVTATSYDAAGNHAAASVGSINLDKTAPTITGASTSLPNASGWFSGDVSIAWTCADNLSGLAASCPADSTITGEGGSLSASASVSDKAGNTGTGTATVKIDRTPPVTTSTVPAPLASGWYEGAVTVTLGASDSLSGVAATYYAIDGGGTSAYTQAFTFDQGGVHTVTFWSVDYAGNSEDRTQAQNTITLKIDNVPPSIAGNALPPPNAGGWNNTPVTVTFSCSDAESGIKSCDPASTVLSSEGAGQAVTGTAVDNAGNSSTGSVSGVNIDLTPPVITPTYPKPNANGWYNSDVTIQWACSDSLSGIAGACPPSSTVSGEGTGLGAGPVTVTDNAGNSQTASVGNLQIDRTAPTIAGVATTSPGPSGWYTGDVTIHWTCDDALSGVASCPADTVVTGSGSDLSTSGTDTDKAGNSASASVSGIMIDRKAPVTGISGLPAGWSRAPVQLSLTPTDDLSGVAATYYSLDGAPPVAGTSVSIAGDGAHSLSFWSVDVAGNQEAANSVQVRVDQTPPTIGYTLDEVPNAAGWLNRDVVVTFACGDATSGVASCTPPQTVSTEGKDVKVTGTAVDNAGNQASTTADLSLDKTPPVVTAKAGSQPNGAGWYRSPVTVGFTCSDALSGVASCPGDVTVSVEGAGQSVSGTALDIAGNSALASVAPINLDLTPPELSGTPVGAPNGAGWYNAPVTIHWTCGDVLSGLAAGCPADSVITTEGVALTAEASASDVAGNTTTSTSAPGVNIDRTPPVTSATFTTNDSGTLSLDSSGSTSWVDQAVSVTLAAGDTLSGVAQSYYQVDGGPVQAGSSVYFGKEGTFSLAYWSVDVAGNAEAPHTATVKIDLTAPSITSAESPPHNAAGWNNTDVTVTFSCDDALSGIASCSTPQTFTSEGAGQVITGIATDNAGNQNQEQVTVNIDETPPTIAGSRTPAANSAGWNDTAVTVSFACDDPLSGIAVCPAETTLGEGAGQSVQGTATDNAGNSASAGVSGVNVDLTPPAITGAPDRAANTSGWYNADVTVSFTCDDALSGVAACSAPVELQEGAAQSATGKAIDLAGNSATATVSGINVDKTAPVLNGAATAAPDSYGWYNSDVTVHWSCHDDLSGLPGPCPADSSITGEGSNLSTGGVSVTDLAGNTTFAIVDGINIDRTPPTVSAAPSGSPNGNGWYNHDVTVSFTCTDPLSGVASCPADVSLKESANAQSVSGTGYDKAGNSASASVGGIQIDESAPTLTGTATTLPNANGWYSGDVTIHWTCVDTISGVASCPGDTVLKGEGAAVTATASATDLAGNTATKTVSVSIDRTAPSIKYVLSPSAPNANGWFNQPVTVSFTCSDALSGIATCPAAVTLTDGSPQPVSGAATDKAGNSASTTVPALKIDTKAPSLTITGVADAATYVLGAVPPAGCTAFDGGSGLSGPCAGTLSGGLANGVGAFTYTATASDLAGNTTTLAVRYSVKYRFDGFLQPINDTAHQVGLLASQFKDGSTIPAKFQLKRADGTIVLPNSAPQWMTPVDDRIALSASAPSSAPAAWSPSGSPYRWDPSGQLWNLPWQSPGSAGDWWTLGVRLDDGQVYWVDIGLR